MGNNKNGITDGERKKRLSTMLNNQNVNVNPSIHAEITAIFRSLFNKPQKKNEQETKLSTGIKRPLNFKPRDRRPKL